jgi:hypothetical protein
MALILAFTSAGGGRDLAFVLVGFSGNDAPLFAAVVLEGKVAVGFPVIFTAWEDDEVVALCGLAADPAAAITGLVGSE